MACSAGAGLIFGGVYLLGLPWYGRSLLFVRQSPYMAVAFMVFCAMAAVNQLTDSVFISARIPQYNLLVDGLIQGLSRLMMPIFLVGLGVFGIVGAMGGSYAVAVIASLVLMAWRLGFRLDFRTRGTRLREQASFSIANYLAALLNLAPLLVIPLIALQKLGAASAGYYFIAFQIANLLNAASHSIGEALFSEASYDAARAGELLRRSGLIMVAAIVPGAGIAAAGSGLLLRLFGSGYELGARPLLVVLSVGSLAVAFNTWATCALRVGRRLRPLVLCNVLFAAVTIGFALTFASRGLVWLGWAWGAGNLASGVLAAAFIVRGRAPAPDTDATDSWPRLAEAVSAGYSFEDAPTAPLLFPWNVQTAIRRRPRTVVEEPEPGAHDTFALSGERREW
jgi:O-antigen/teichoic acid export membrane protein